LGLFRRDVLNIDTTRHQTVVDHNTHPANTPPVIVDAVSVAEPLSIMLPAFNATALRLQLY
jgi:hypothetical protein